MIGEMREKFEQIFKAVQVSWGRLGKGWKAFLFHVCGRLGILEKVKRFG